MSISVIGLGKIGSEIVPHLLGLGQEVRVWNRSAAAVERLLAPGVVPARDIAEAFDADIVLSALFNDLAVEEAFTEETLAAGPNGALHICLSTLSPDLAGRMARLHAQAGVGYVAAPLFGRPEAVRQKAANICVAGEKELIERARPVLETFGRVWEVGNDPRQANVAKLCGNFMIGAAVGAMAEVSAVLSAEDADPNAFLHFMAETLFAGPIYRSYWPSVTGARPLPASGLGLPMKDIGLLAELAEKHGIGHDVLAALRNNLDAAAKSGLGDEDWSVALASLARR